MSPPISAEAVRLVDSLYEERSLLERVRRQDHRIASLARIATLREVRVVPYVLPLLAAGDVLAPHVGRTVADLARDITPAQLAWLDEQVRRGSHPYYGNPAWQKVSAAGVPRLAEACGHHPTVIGLLASHANGFVRAAALEVLAQRGDGRELPFLSLRANDWVEPVATRAAALLLDRVRPDNRPALLDALPFIVRTFAQRRRDHAGIERALGAVLRSDGGQDALSRAPGFATPVRRMLYELLTGDTAAVSRPAVDAALNDSDGVIRARALRTLAANVEFERRDDILERLLRADPVPAVRRLALTLLSEQRPRRVSALFPDILLDRAASVRALARFVASTHDLAIDPREVYVRTLGERRSKRLVAAIEGVGETGAAADADLVARFSTAPSRRIRRAALRALARLDVTRAVSSAMTALDDDAPSVRSAAIHILANQASRVDFDGLSRRVASLAAADTRRDLLGVYLRAPKWEAPVFLLHALADPDGEVRDAAVRLVEEWIRRFNRTHTRPTATQLQRIGRLLDSAGARLPEHTARLMRFSLQ